MNHAERCYRTARFSNIHRHCYLGRQREDFVGWYDEQTESYMIYHLPTKFLQRFPKYFQSWTTIVSGDWMQCTFKDIV